MAWVLVVAAVVLGVGLLKAVFDPDEKIYRCPTCNIVIRKNIKICPNCRTQLEWK